MAGITAAARHCLAWQRSVASRYDSKLSVKASALVSAWIDGDDPDQQRCAIMLEDAANLGARGWVDR
jgi:hypothetical protein